MDTNQSMNTLRITQSFEDYGFWIQYKSYENEGPSSQSSSQAELVIGESKLGEARRFISGIGQQSGAIVKVQVMASSCEHFFVVVNRDGTLYKYKLLKSHIMSPVPDEALEIRPRVPGLRALATFWSKLPQNIADSRKAIVAAATSMLATNPSWYREGLQFVRKNRRWEDYQVMPSSSQAARAEPVPPRPSEDPLTAPYARCFAKVPHHPDFGLPRPIRRSTYTPGLLRQGPRDSTFDNLDCEAIEHLQKRTRLM